MAGSGGGTTDVAVVDGMAFEMGMIGTNQAVDRAGTL